MPITPLPQRLRPLRKRRADLRRYAPPTPPPAPPAVLTVVRVRPVEDQETWAEWVFSGPIDDPAGVPALFVDGWPAVQWHFDGGGSLFVNHDVSVVPGMAWNTPGGSVVGVSGATLAAGAGMVQV